MAVSLMHFIAFFQGENKIVEVGENHGVGAYGNTSNMGQSQIKIHRADMSDELQQDALQVASLASNRYEGDWDIAHYITEEFEKRQEGYWNCVVGKYGEYAASVTYKRNFYFRFSLGNKIFTVFRSP